MDIFFQVLEYRACVIHYLLTRPTALTGSWSWKIRNLRKAATAHFTHHTSHISLYTSPYITLHICLCLPTRVIPPSTKSCFARGSNTYFLHQMQIKSYMLYNAVFCFFLLIFCFSLLQYTYYYNYKSHISLQVAKLAKSAGLQILIFPTVCSTVASTGRIG